MLYHSFDAYSILAYTCSDDATTHICMLLTVVRSHWCDGTRRVARFQQMIRG